MTKPDDIPQDVWDAARAFVGVPDSLGYAKVFTESAARAILAERERCAEIANHLTWLPSATSRNTEAISRVTADWGGKIAAAIRKGGAA